MLGGVERGERLVINKGSLWLFLTLVVINEGIKKVFIDGLGLVN